MTCCTDKARIIRMWHRYLECAVGVLLPMYGGGSVTKRRHLHSPAARDTRDNVCADGCRFHFKLYSVQYGVIIQQGLRYDREGPIIGLSSRRSVLPRAGKQAHGLLCVKKYIHIKVGPSSLRVIASSLRGMLVRHGCEGCQRCFSTSSLLALVDPVAKD